MRIRNKFFRKTDKSEWDNVFFNFEVDDKSIDDVPGETKTMTLLVLLK